MVKYQQQYGCLLNTQKKGLKVCLQWKVHLAYPASLKALNLKKHSKIKNPNWQEATSLLFTSVAKI